MRILRLFRPGLEKVHGAHALGIQQDIPGSTTRANEMQQPIDTPNKMNNERTKRRNHLTLQREEGFLLEYGQQCKYGEKAKSLLASKPTALWQPKQTRIRNQVIRIELGKFACEPNMIKLRMS